MMWKKEAIKIFIDFSSQLSPGSLASVIGFLIITNFFNALPSQQTCLRKKKNIIIIIICLSISPTIEDHCFLLDRLPYTGTWGVVTVLTIIKDYFIIIIIIRIIIIIIIINYHFIWQILQQ